MQVPRWNSTWQKLALVLSFVLAFSGWAFSLGIQHQMVKTNERDIASIQAELRESRATNTALAVQVARLTEAVNNLRGSLDDGNERK